jgi:hypothetical protein
MHSDSIPLMLEVWHLLPLKQNCAICKAKHLCAIGVNTRIQKRAHHKACPTNLTGGTSEMTAHVHKEAARNLAANRAAIGNKTVDKSQKEISSACQGFFAQRTNHRCTNRVATAAPRSSITTVTAGIPATHAGLLTGLSTTAVASASSMSTLADPTSLRRELDERMKKLESEGDDCSWSDNKKYPAGIGSMVDCVLNLFEHRKPASTAPPAPDTVAKQEAIEKCRAFFRPGSLESEFQKDCGAGKNKKNEPPSPHCHALEGQSIVHVDWKLAFPEVDLLCCNFKICGAKKHPLQDRTNFSKRKQLFPVWTHSGLPVWCVTMSHKCEFCDASHAGDDGRLLSLLPGNIADAHKVLPTHASGNVYLHQELSDDMELLLKTCTNAKFVSKKLHRKLGIVHSPKALTCLLRRTPRMSEWLSYEIFTGGFTPPTPAVLRTCFENAEDSVLTPHGCPNFDRHE